MPSSTAEQLHHSRSTWLPSCIFRGEHSGSSADLRGQTTAPDVWEWCWWNYSSEKEHWVRDDIWGCQVELLHIKFAIFDMSPENVLSDLYFSFCSCSINKRSTYVHCALLQGRAILSVTPQHNVLLGLLHLVATGCIDDSCLCYLNYYQYVAKWKLSDVPSSHLYSEWPSTHHAESRGCQEVLLRATRQVLIICNLWLFCTVKSLPVSKP